MKSPNTKSSDHLKAEVDQDLKKVEKSLDNLQRRLTPGQILDDLVFYPHQKSLKSTLNHLQHNPVGTTFLTLGTILLMEDRNHHTLEWTTREKVRSAQHTARENLRDVRELKQKTKEKIKAVKKAFETKASSISQEVKEIVDESEQNISLSLEDKKGKIKNKAQDFYFETKEKFQNMDSLSFLALGAGLGIVTGSSLPILKKEHEFVHEKIGDDLFQLGEELQEAINKSSNILKDLMVHDLKDYDLRLFKE